MGRVNSGASRDRTRAIPITVRTHPSIWIHLFSWIQHPSSWMHPSMRPLAAAASTAAAAAAAAKPVRRPGRPERRLRHAGSLLRITPSSWIVWAVSANPDWRVYPPGLAQPPRLIDLKEEYPERNPTV